MSGCFSIAGAEVSTKFEKATIELDRAIEILELLVSRMEKIKIRRNRLAKVSNLGEDAVEELAQDFEHFQDSAEDVQHGIGTLLRAIESYRDEADDDRATINAIAGLLGCDRSSVVDVFASVVSEADRKTK